MNRAAWCVLLLACLALAGCAGDEPSEEEKFKEAVEHGSAADVPVWEIGEYWTYEASAGEQVLGTSSFVVTGEQGGDYIVETNDKNIAYFDARFDISFMGEIRKSDLAGSQNGQRIEMFQWPISADLTWTATWDEEKLDMEAMDMGPNQWHVMGHRQSDGAMVVDYHYNAAKKWFEYIVFYDADNGTEGFRLDLKDNGVDFTGTIYRYTLQDIQEFSASGPGSFMDSQFSAGEANELGLQLVVDCGGSAAGHLLASFKVRDEAMPVQAPPVPIIAEPEFGTMHDCSASPDNDIQALRDVAEEENGFHIHLASAAESGSVTLFIEPRVLERFTL